MNYFYFNRTTVLLIGLQFYSVMCPSDSKPLGRCGLDRGVLERGVLERGVLEQGVLERGVTEQGIL